MEETLFFRTEKGKPSLVFQGYMYTINRQCDNKVYWVCRKRGQCKARVHTDSAMETVTKTIGDHTHQPDPLEIGVQEAKTDFYTNSVTTNDSGHQLLLKAAVTLSEDVAANLPSLNTLKRSIRRHRQAKHLPLPKPTSREELIIPDSLKQTVKGDKFLIFDSGPEDKDRILIFSTQRNITKLKNARFWLADGTFKVVPEIFFQLYTIHALVDDISVPLVFALLPDKKGVTYIRMLESLREVAGPLSPEYICLDFEKAAMNAFSATFPKAQLQGCLFHLSQCVFRHIKSSGLHTLYRSDKDVNVKLRMLPALGFLPEEDVIGAFEDLVDTFSPEMLVIADYFEDTFIGTVRRGARATAPFPISFWNTYPRVLEDLPRTTNYVEGWHRSFQATIECSHPNVFKFLENLKQEQALTELKLARMEAGAYPEPRKPRYDILNRRIYKVVSEYNGQDKMAFLKKLTYSFSF